MAIHSELASRLNNIFYRVDIQKVATWSDATKNWSNTLIVSLSDNNCVSKFSNWVIYLLHSRAFSQMNHESKSSKLSNKIRKVFKIRRDFLGLFASFCVFLRLFASFCLFLRLLRLFVSLCFKMNKYQVSQRTLELIDNWPIFALKVSWKKLGYSLI